ncbi:radical SAM protein [Campylobacter jejuni]
MQSRITELEKINNILLNNMTTGGGITEKIKKITPRPFLNGISFHLAEHCNLNCFSCNNFSQIAKKGYYELNQFEKDVQKIFHITKGMVEQFYLAGGEPLMNKDCKEYFYILRKYFKNNSIWLITNGILLPKQDNSFWKALKENNIILRPTKYPLKIDWENIKQKCKEYNITLSFFNDENIEKTSFKTALNLKGDSNPFDNFTICHRANIRIQIKDGIVYPCPIVANIKYFNSYFKQNLQISNRDYLELKKITSYDEILNFISKPLPFCRYCAISKMDCRPWCHSTKNITEYAVN